MGREGGGFCRGEVLAFACGCSLCSCLLVISYTHTRTHARTHKHTSTGATTTTTDREEEGRGGVDEAEDHKGGTEEGEGFSHACVFWCLCSDLLPCVDTMMMVLAATQGGEGKGQALEEDNSSYGVTITCVVCLCVC